MNDYNDFIKRFNVRHVQVVRDRNYETIDYNGYNQTASYYSNREQLIEIELSRSGFDELVRIDRKLEVLGREAGDEAYMRRKHPALKEAYDKYKMLMELYR
jgi:hypothetical protein